MKVYRSAVLRGQDAYESFKNILKHISFAKVDTETDNKTLFYISDSWYLELSINNGSVSVNIKNDTLNYKSSIYSNSNLTIMSVYAYNDTCFAIALSTSSANVLYSQIFIDKINNGNMAFIIFSNSGSCIFDTEGVVTPEATVGKPPQYVAVKYAKTLLTDVIDAKLGFVAENLKLILATPLDNAFVTFNGKPYLFSNGLALPCGTESSGKAVEYIYE